MGKMKKKLIYILIPLKGKVNKNSVPGDWDVWYIGTELFISSAVLSLLA